jgi:uncharacterized membrane protein YdjX (TVP38/TMEM64 family)
MTKNEAQRRRWTFCEAVKNGTWVSAQGRTKPLPMTEAGTQPRKDKGPLVKAAALVAFIIVAVYLVRYSPVRGYFTPEALTSSVRAAGLWAPVAFIVVYAAGVCLFLPGTLLTALGAAIFGAYWGFVYVWIGAMIGAGAAFWIGRTLGREFAAFFIGDRLRKYDDAIERNGFATVLYLRLVYFPFTPMNFGMGLTKVGFRDYVAGTGLGILVGTFIVTFLVGTVREVWVSGDWARLLSFKVFFAVGLFISSLFIPKVVKRFRKD